MLQCHQYALRSIKIESTKSVRCVHRPSWIREGREVTDGVIKDRESTYSDLDRLALDVHADLQLQVIHQGSVDLEPIVLKRGHSVRGNRNLALLGRGLGLCLTRTMKSALATWTFHSLLFIILPKERARVFLLC